MIIRVGDVGRAATDLAPGGAVELDGVRYPARSDGDAPVAAGTAVEVVRAEATCLVVRAAGSAAALPGRGEPLGPLGFDTNRAAVARAERHEERERRTELLKRMRVGGLAAAAFGLLVGAANSWLGWRNDWGGVTERTDLPTLLGGSAAAGAGLGVVLYFFTGWFIAHVLPAEEGARFEPSFVAILAGFVGAALGFWLNLRGGDALTIAATALGMGLAFAAVAAGVARALDVL